MSKHSIIRRGAAVAGALSATALLSLALPALEAGATSGTATVTAGTFGFVSTPSTVSFSDTLNGLNQTPTATQGIDVGDATGSGSGWNITATSTTFTCTSAPAAGTCQKSTGVFNEQFLSTTATTIQATGPTVACDASSTCTTANNTVSYPYTLPAASVAPAATKMYNANTNAGAGTGLGDQTVTATFQLAVPANTYIGTYSSTWTYSLVSGP